MARAILSDTLQGPALRRHLATLTSIFMVAPILAPLAGGGLIALGWAGGERPFGRWR
jgi:hypothetical protein